MPQAPLHMPAKGALLLIWAPPGMRFASLGHLPPSTSCAFSFSGLLLNFVAFSGLYVAFSVDLLPFLVDVLLFPGLFVASSG